MFAASASADERRQCRRPVCRDVNREKESDDAVPHFRRSDSGDLLNVRAAKIAHRQAAGHGWGDLLSTFSSRAALTLPMTIARHGARTWDR
jgi:hypothetical protein